MIKISKLKAAKEAALNLNLFEKTAYNAYGAYPQEAYLQGGQYPDAPDAPRFMSPLVQGLGGLGIAGMGAYSLLKSTPQILASPVKPRGAGLDAALAMLIASGAGYGLKGHWKDKGKPAASEALSATIPATIPAATFQVGPTETFYHEFSPSATGPASKATGSGRGGKPPTKATNSASSSTALHKLKRLQQQGILPESYKLSPALKPKGNHFGVTKPSIDKVRAVRSLLDKLKGVIGIAGGKRNSII